MKVDVALNETYTEAWNGFAGSDWQEAINVRDFIQHNYTPYEGDESFLAEATPATAASGERHACAGGFRHQRRHHHHRSRAGLH